MDVELSQYAHGKHMAASQPRYGNQICTPLVRARVLLVPDVNYLSDLHCLVNEP